MDYPQELICKPTFCSSHRADGPGPGSNVHHGRILQPWNPEVSTFGHSYRKHSLNSVIHDCSFTSIDCKAAFSLSGAAHKRGGAIIDTIVIKISSPVYKEACKALPPIPNNTEYRATLLSRLATWFAAGCDIPLAVVYDGKITSCSTQRSQYACDVAGGAS